ncbi:class I SAM-dependent methyltransferase [Brevundimonas sp.]|uniref:class I SAM-dependent methyltransferase n=1 Tax=Brevundimonas sp. TaxID=1871086 RepID=UPI00286A9F61|nr:class I SAM-dependent methyltransferase [Brevundimonas sp.]
MILGRDPESQSVIDDHVAHYTTQTDLNAAMRDSDEVRRRFENAATSLRASPYLGASHRVTRGVVEHETDPQTLAAMLARIQDQWTTLGETEPMYSVISQPEFLTANLDDRALQLFRTGGAQEAADVDLFASRAGVGVRHGVCLELGCGVGRITRHLAGRFEHVFALDISPGNLAACEAYMAEIGVTNVTTVLIRSLDDFDALPPADCLYSFIVLQHNPPPIQKQMLRKLFAHLRPGGVALFQIPSDMKGYAFDAASYLASPPPEMEMHGLPRPVVLAEMQRAGLVVLDVVPDDCLGEYGSFTFFGARPTEE